MNLEAAWIRFNTGALRRAAGIALCWAMLLAVGLRAEDASFTNSLASATLAETRGDVSAALKIYTEVEQLEATNAASLCVLARRYCDLMYVTNSTAIQKDLAERALACSLRAVKADPANATAHACVAVCYAKNCLFADLKTQLAYSQLFKQAAENAIALDPRQDVAYYLLGRWHYGVANVGLLSRAFVKVVYGGLPKASNADAIRFFQKAIELAPERIIHHAGLAMVYAATGEKSLEVAELETCRALKPTGREDADAQREAQRTLTALGR